MRKLYNSTKIIQSQYVHCRCRNENYVKCFGDNNRIRTLTNRIPDQLHHQILIQSLCTDHSVMCRGTIIECDVRLILYCYKQIKFFGKNNHFPHKAKHVKLRSLWGMYHGNLPHVIGLSSSNRIK